MVRFRRRRPTLPGRSSIWDNLLPAYLRSRRKKRGPDLEDGGVPVEPNRPKDMSGGAAAALEFDD